MKGKFETGLKLFRLLWSRFGFFKKGLMCELLKDTGTVSVSKERFMIFVMIDNSSGRHNLGSHVGSGSSSQDLLADLFMICSIFSLDAGLNSVSLFSDKLSTSIAALRFSFGFELMSFRMSSILFIKKSLKF